METLAKKIDLHSFPQRTLAYIRHVGPYKGNSQLFAQLFQRLMQWAGPKGYMAQPGMEMITVYHDDPETTPEDQERISVGITVPDDADRGEDIRLMNLPAGKFVVGSFEILPDAYEKAWEEVFAYLSEQQIQPSGGPMYESYKNDPTQHPEGKHVVDICVAVVI